MKSSFRFPWLFTLLRCRLGVPVVVLFAACGEDVSVGFNRRSPGQGGGGAGENVPSELAGAGGVGVVRSNLVTQITAGWRHTCARFGDGRARCWGWNAFGQLGYGNATVVPATTLARAGGDIPVGGSLQAITSGNWSNFTCGLLDGGRLRCWGENMENTLGYGNTQSSSDTQTPAVLGDVPLGGHKVTQVATGRFLTCALFTGGNVRCWGTSGRGQKGRAIEIDSALSLAETPASVPDILLPGPATQIAVGPLHACALLQDGQVSCWGAGNLGQLFIAGRPGK